MNSRVLSTFGSVFLLSGAFAIGWVFHQVLVERTIAPTAPAALIGGLVGLLAILVGRRLEQGFDPSSFIVDPEDEDDERFDERFSPVDEDMLAGRERDD